jgi:hypothetical protein
MNEIAAMLGEAGLPAPIAELARQLIALEDATLKV